MTRVGRVLRSRKLALWLLLGLGAWSVIGTFTAEPLPNTDPLGAVEGTPLEVAARVLGLADPFSSPVFLFAVSILALATTLCAWDRTRLALSQARAAGTLTERAIDRLKSSPTLAIPIVGSADAADALAATEHGIRSCGLATVSGPAVVEGATGRWRLAGSSLFHWSLVALVITFMLGGLTRAEGLMGVPVGETRLDEAESYGSLEEGPLYFGHSGLDIGVSDLVLGHVVDDVDRGPAPVITLSREGEVVATQRVFPNNPLRYGSLLIHMDDYGFAPTVVLADASGNEITSEVFFVDFDEGMPGGLTVIEFALAGAEGTSDAYRTRLTLALPEEGQETGTALMEVYDADGLINARPIRVGEAFELPTGEQLILESVGEYARLSIADDWSVRPIYVLFGIAIIGLTVALVFPYRRVQAMVVTEPGPRVNLRVRRARDAAVFLETLEEAVRTSLAAISGEDDHDD